MNATGQDSTPSSVPAPSAPDTPPARIEALVLAATAVVVAALGAPLGLLWSALSPRVGLTMTADGAMYDPETEMFAAADGRFTLITAAAGLLVAVGCWVLLRRYRGPLMLLAAGLGAAGSSWLASVVGAGVGRGDYNHLLAHAAAGWHFWMPLQLGARGALAVEALVVVLVYTVVAGCSRYSTLYARRWRRDRRRGAGPSDAAAGAPRGAAASTAPGGEAGDVVGGDPVEVARPSPDAAVPGVAWPQTPPAAERRPDEAAVDGPTIELPTVRPPGPPGGHPSGPAPAPGQWPEAPGRR